MSVFRTPENKDIIFSDCVVFAYGDNPKNYQYSEYSIDQLGIADTDIFTFKSFGNYLAFNKAFTLQYEDSDFLVVELLSYSREYSLLPKIDVIEKMKFTDALKHKSKLKRNKKKGKK